MTKLDDPGLEYEVHLQDLRRLRGRPMGVKTYECRVLLVPEDAGGFSAHATQLPGLVSQGESEEEALENIREAFRGVASVYQETGRIPWSPVEMERSKDSLERWILVDA